MNKQMNASEAKKLSLENAKRIKLEKQLEDERMSVNTQEKVDKQLIKEVHNGRTRAVVNYDLYDNNIKNLKDRGFDVVVCRAYTGPKYIISWQ